MINFCSNYFLTGFSPEKVIGIGTFGCVLKVKHRAYCLYSTCALKMISLKSRVELEKTLDEVSRMERLSHPGIVRYQNAWLENLSEEGKRSVAKSVSNFEEYFHQLCNESLAEWRSRNPYRDLDQMKSWFQHIITALEYIHSQNIFHRDLKPSNILVASEKVVKI
ncbi:hypothetical protein PENTCL1PPCAC_9066, partial [Pristionchus entomophagus]